MQVLVLTGANLNACTASGTSALFIASYVGHAACVRVLLQAGADPHTGGSCMECARSRGFPKIAQLISQDFSACVEGFVFDSSAMLRKWAPRFFLVSVSQGILFVNQSSRSIKQNMCTAASQPADGVTSMIARGCFIMRLESPFEGKRCVLKFRSPGNTGTYLSSQVSFAVVIKMPVLTNYFLAQIHYFAFSSEFSMQLMLRWLHLLGAQPFSTCVDASPTETVAPSVNMHTRYIAGSALLHVRSDALEDARVPLLSSSDV